MAEVNWDNYDEATAGQPESLKAGIYYAEIKDAEEKNSKAGNAMIAIALKTVDGGRYLVRDWIMLEGNDTAINMGRARLSCLGMKGVKAFCGTDLIGKRVYVAVAVDTKSENGQLKVNSYAPTSKAGYWPESEKPANVVEIPKADDTPF